MSMRDFTMEANTGTESIRPRVYGDIKYRNVLLNRRQKARVEKEMLGWILCHTFPGSRNDEIQYWVSFKQSDPGKSVLCQVEVFGALQMWESSESSTEPFKAFRHCLAELNPVLLNSA